MELGFFRKSGIIFLVSFAAALVLTGCATADKEPLVKGSTSTRPPSLNNAPSNPGSLFPTTPGATGQYRPLFEDPRARNVGDTLTIVLNERTSANRSSNASAEKTSTADITADLSSLSNISGVVKGLPGSGIARSLAGRATAAANSVNGITAEGTVEYEGAGTAAAQNAFTGTITVTVMEVLPNGNLVVAGEKQVAVSSEEEIIRVSGVVSPAVLVRNQVTSDRVADLRLEYRGRGFGDDTSKPGWLTGVLMKISPF
ncbi:MAG: flagellar basal body L-ring protein [Burkholderiaceae bacterium]|nr:flagellar basal body L-ring protein [Burkholderiaceae bacterium]